MDEKLKELLETKIVEAMEKIEQNLGDSLKTMVSDEVKQFTAKLRAERAVFGRDYGFLSDEQKIQLVNDLRQIAKGQKAALIESQDNLGGFFVAPEVHKEVVRLAASAGLVLNFARKYDMKSDELDVPRYTGSDLEGQYPEEDTEGTEESLTFGNARLIAKNWQSLVRVSNPLLADASVATADILLGLFAEALANRSDKEGLVGTGAPFVGIQETADVTVKALAATKTKPEDIDLDVCSDLIAAVKPTALRDAVFLFHRTVWHSLRTKKDTAGNYVIGFQGNPIVGYSPESQPAIKPAGFIWGFPVYLSEHLLSATGSAQADKKFGIFGSLSHLAFGDREPLRVAQSEHATVGGKNVFAANQTAIRVNHRHGIVVALPKAFVIVKTAAS
jgi:HK97 family phage major capsid protein